MQITHHITSFHRQEATSKDYGQIPQWVCTTQEGDLESNAPKQVDMFDESKAHDAR